MHDLARLVAIPSVSTDGRHQREIAESAKAVAELMQAAGLQRVKTFAPGKANPFVFGEWTGAKGKPTLLLYAHHDVQPAANEREWKSSPWKLTRRNGRLFGRGSADDKGAIIAQLGAIQSLLKTRGELPVNIKMLVEGEEEIGSVNLIPFVQKNRKLVHADAIVVCDTGNVTTGQPSITYSLRGVISARLEVQCAQGPRHSGFAGGVMPDAALALNVILSRLFWKNGKIPVPGFYDGVIPMSARERQWLKALPMRQTEIRKELAVLDEVDLANRLHPFEQIWRQPAVTVIAQEASSLAHVSNQVLGKATAVVSCRVAPGQDRHHLISAITNVLTREPPWNARVTVTPGQGVPAWICDPTGPMFDAARKAMRQGFGKEPAMIGAGGSIGFVKPMSELLNDAPVLMLGIEDPFSNAHAPDESLHEGDFLRLTESLARLFEALGS